MGEATCTVCQIGEARQSQSHRAHELGPRTVVGGGGMDEAAPSPVLIL